MTSNRKITSPLLIGFCLLGTMLSLSGCINSMDQQPKVKPLEDSDFFLDGRSSRPRVPGTIARGHLELDELLYTGKIKGEEANLFPFPVTPEVLARGQERFNIYCAVCHDRVGTGNGMIVRRGFPKPPSFHSDGLVKAPAGHFVSVMTSGFGRMYPYADRLTAQDRWAVAAYIRALQLSQSVKLTDIPEREQISLKNEPVQPSTSTAWGALTTW